MHAHGAHHVNISVRKGLTLVRYHGNRYTTVLASRCVWCACSSVLPRKIESTFTEKAVLCCCLSAHAAMSSSQPPLVVVELTTDVNSTVGHLEELGKPLYPIIEACKLKLARPDTVNCIRVHNHSHTYGCLSL